MSYVVNTGEDKLCDKCKSRIGVAKGFYTQWGRILCIDCQESFVDFVKQKYNEFIQPERLSPEGVLKAEFGNSFCKNDISDSPNSTNK